MSMFPKPTNIMKRFAPPSLVFLLPYDSFSFRVSTFQNDSSSKEEGFAVYFSYDDLEKQGKLSSDKLSPHKRVIEDMLTVARKYYQIHIMLWYPYQFGTDEYVNEDDKYRHYSIIQSIIPTRTGLDGIKSTSAVWLSSVNESAPQNFDLLKTRHW
jgi:hypothetical protein